MKMRSSVPKRSDKIGEEIKISRKIQNLLSIVRKSSAAVEEG